MDCAVKCAGRTLTSTPIKSADANVYQIFKKLIDAMETDEQKYEFMKYPLTFEFLGPGFLGLTLEALLSDEVTRENWRADQVLGYYLYPPAIQQRIQEVRQRISFAHVMALLRIFQDGVIKRGIAGLRDYEWNDT